MIPLKAEKLRMADIARELGVSTISVSRALAGQDGVSEELRRRILQKAAEMGYSKNRGLSGCRVLVLHQKPFLQDNSNFSRILQGMERELQEAECEYDLEFVDKSSQQGLRLPGKVLKGASYSAALCIGRFDTDYVNRLAERIPHTVFYTGYSPAGGSDCVWYNFNRGAYRECEYLIGRGHRRIGYVGGSPGYVSREKRLGIECALEDAGLCADETFFCNTLPDFTDRLCGRIREGAGPTALICQWDYTAVQVVKALHDQGLRVPEDVSVVGYGNTEMAALCIPALTTCELHIDYACHAAVELLRRRLRQPDKPAETVLVDSTLIARDSVRPLG